MKPFLILLFLGLCILSQSFLGFTRAEVVFPISDSYDSELPRNLRTTLCPYAPYGEERSLNLNGFHHLRISGSGQFSERAFVAMLNSLSLFPEKLIVIDLRQESHGLINGHPVSWTDGKYNYANIHKTKAEIESDESLRLMLAAQAKQIVIDPVEKPVKLAVHDTKTEQELVQGCGATYIRLPVTDHNCPKDEIIDQFVEIVKNLEPDQWVHMHCRAGKGRTTTFLALFDIMQNVQHVSLEDILARQQLIGGTDLSELKKVDFEKTKGATERFQLIQNFYLYCQQVPNFDRSWSEWLKQQRK